MVNSEFEDIRIVGFDEDAARKGEPGSALMYLVLKLSASAPYTWAQGFNTLWKSHFYMIKRRAEVSGDQLELYCVPDELEKHHLPELKKVVSKTNKAYRQILAENKRVAQAQAAADEVEQAKLAEIKSRLNFD